MPAKKAKPVKAKKTTVAKAAVKKTASKKTVAKKTVTKKAEVKKPAVKKATVKKPVIKKVAEEKPTVKKAVVKKTIVKKAAVKKATAPRIKEIKDISEELILTKYETGAHTHYTDAEYKKDILEIEEPPYCYDINRVVVLPVDPTFAFLYWEVREDTMNAMFQQFGYDSKLTLRVYDVTNIEFNGLNANEWWDVEIYNRIGTWYLKHFKGDRNLIVDVGVKSSDGNYHVINRSKTAYFPRATMVAPGKIFWMLVDEFGNKRISEIEDFTEDDLILLRKIMGEDRFKRFLKGGMDIFLGSSAWGKIPLIENYIELAKLPSSMPSSRSGSGWR